MTENVSDLVLDGNAAAGLLQEIFVPGYNDRTTSMRGMRLYRRRRLFASICGSNGRSFKVQQLRWHSDEGGPYTAWSLA